MQENNELKFEIIITSNKYIIKKLCIYICLKIYLKKNLLIIY